VGTGDIHGSEGFPAYTIVDRLAVVATTARLNTVMASVTIFEFIILATLQMTEYKYNKYRESLVFLKFVSF
jgi:hypothetical protein